MSKHTVFTRAMKSLLCSHCSEPWLRSHYIVTFRFHCPGHWHYDISDPPTLTRIPLSVKFPITDNKNVTLSTTNNVNKTLDVR
jgi:hypothetical protein